MYWADERLGPARLEEAYPWQSLVRSGSIIAGGSDAPVEHPDPLAGIYAAVTRQDQTGRPEGGWQPQERLTIRQAILMYTEWPAYASFEEDRKGKIAPGYFADFTVLSNDLGAIDVGQIPDTRVLFTVVNGNVVYEGK
ncbi:MAG: amidohydrolase family protein, partial [FCB group bacterium]|nr:amidohydrolase family protein [FCB group bacterium]